MSIKNHQGNEVNNTGNPTHSQLANDMIKKVKQIEVGKQGKALQAGQPITTAEIKTVLQELHNLDSVEALLCFQLSSHDQYTGNTGRFGLAWSKNMTDECDARWRHLFGCIDCWVFCTIFQVGLCLEIYHTIMPNAREDPFVAQMNAKVCPQSDGTDCKLQHQSHVCATAVAPFA